MVKIKVADFGLSKIIVANEVMIDSCGTQPYMAPEILKKEGYGREVDMWAAGVIYYTLVCRQLPFMGQDRSSTKLIIKEWDPDMNHIAF